MIHSLLKKYIIPALAVISFASLSYGATETLCNGQRYDLNTYACVNSQLRPITKCPNLNTTAPAVWRYALILDNYLLVNSGLTPDQLLVKYGQYFHDVELYYRINFNINMQRIYTYVETTSPSFSSNINTTLLDDFGNALREFAFGANIPRDAAQYVLLTGRGFPSDGVIGLTYESSACNSIYSGGDNFNYIYDIDASDTADKVIRIAIHEISHSFGGDHPDTFSSDLYSCEISLPGDSDSDDRIMRRSVLDQSPSNPSPLGYYFLEDSRYISDCASMAMRAHLDEFKCLWSVPADNSVILYSEPNFSGNQYTANIRFSVTDCVDVSGDFNDETQSFTYSSSNKIQFSAIRFWSEFQCTGDSFVVSGAQSSDLGAFGDSISSFDIIYFEGTACPALSSPPVTSSGQASTTSSSPSSSGAVTSTSGSSSSTSSCALISVRQALTNSWQTGSQIYTQYDVTYTNAAATGATQINVQLGGGAINQIWGVEKQADNLYHLPSYVSNGLAAGSTFTWGYVIASSSPASITIIYPACQSSSSSSATTSSFASGVTSTSSSSSTSGAASTSCSATVTGTTVSSWSSGGQVTVSIVNTGSVAITALQFNIQHSSSAVLDQLWNAQQQRTGAYSPDSWAFPMAVGSTLTSVGFTYDGSAALGVSLASVSCL